MKISGTLVLADGTTYTLNFGGYAVSEDLTAEKGCILVSEPIELSREFQPQIRLHFSKDDQN